MQCKPFKRAMNYLCCVLFKVWTSWVRIWRQVVSYELTHLVSPGSCLSKKELSSISAQIKLIKAFSWFPGATWNVIVCYLVFMYLILLKCSPVKIWASLKAALPPQAQKAHYLSQKLSCFQKDWCFKAISIMVCLSQCCFAWDAFYWHYLGAMLMILRDGVRHDKPFLLSLSITLEMVFGTAELEMSVWLGVKNLKTVRGVLEHLPKPAAGG